LRNVISFYFYFFLPKSGHLSWKKHHWRVWWYMHKRFCKVWKTCIKTTL